LISISQSRITRSEPNTVLKVRVTLRLPPRGPGVRIHTVTESLPTIQTGEPIEHNLHGAPPFLRKVTLA
jgi:hypothetical protein